MYQYKHLKWYERKSAEKSPEKFHLILKSLKIKSQNTYIVSNKLLIIYTYSTNVFSQELRIGR